MRVRAHHFQLRDNEYVPFIETDAADAYREVALVAQPGSQEAFLAAPEREVLARRPARHGQDAEHYSWTSSPTSAPNWGANWKGILIRQSMTGFPEIKSLCAQGDPADMAECALQPEPKSVELADRRDAQIGLFR